MSAVGQFLHPSTTRGKVVIGVIAVAAVAIGYRSFQSSAPKRAPETSVPVSVAKVARQDVPVTRIGYGTVRAFNSVVLKVRVDGALQKVLDKAGWKVEDVDLFEVNEAFAVVAMAPMRELGIPHAKLNVNGGATALGHPIGASGARLVVTLVNALRQRGGKRGVASLCIGGGEATALAIELV